MLSCASLVSVGYAPAIAPPASSRRHNAAKLSDAAPPPKVVVTGISALTSLSSDCSAHTFFDNLIAGKCGIGPLTRFDTTNHAVKIGAQIHDFDVEANGAWTAKEAKRYDRHIHYAMAASKAALDDAALDAATVDPKRFGVLVGTGAGGMEAVETATKTLYEKGEKRLQRSKEIREALAEKIARSPKPHECLPLNYGASRGKVWTEEEDASRAVWKSNCRHLSPVLRLLTG